MSVKNVQYLLGTTFSSTVSLPTGNHPMLVFMELYFSESRIAVLRPPEAEVIIDEHSAKISVPPDVMEDALTEDELEFTYAIFAKPWEGDRQELQSGSFSIRGQLDLRDDFPVLPEKASLFPGVIMHYSVVPQTVEAAAVLAATNLDETEQTVAAGITDPDVPCVLSVTGSAAGMSEDVSINGLNAQGEAITDTIAMSGTDTVEGTKAFMTVTSIIMPAETHAHAAQVETATIVGTISTSGNATVTVTANGMTGSPKAKSVAVLENEDADTVAEKIRTALAADADVTAMFNVSGEGADVVLTRNQVVANDGTLNIAYTNGTCAGLTPDASSSDTTAGVAYDKVSIGVTKKIGIPHIVDNAACLLVKLFDGSTDEGTLAVDADEVEKNIFSINGTPNSAKILDLYYIKLPEEDQPPAEEEGGGGGVPS